MMDISGNKRNSLTKRIDITQTEFKTNLFANELETEKGAGRAVREQYHLFGDQRRSKTCPHFYANILSFHSFSVELFLDTNSEIYLN